GSRAEQTGGGNKRSAFFSCLPLRAKSAMAEILVSDFCECRPPPADGGVFHGHEGARDGASADSHSSFRVSHEGCSDASLHFRCSLQAPGAFSEKEILSRRNA